MSRHEPPDLPPDVIVRALDGEPNAFRQFFERYDPTVRWAVGMRVYRWPELVPSLEDIVQEVWLELMRRKAKRLRYHDSSRGVPFHRFLGLVCARYAWRIAKRELRHPTDELVDVLVDDDWSFAVKLMHADFLERLTEKVERMLNETDRELFEGYYVRGERLKDVGGRLGLTENATYKRKERLLKKLKELADDLLEARRIGVGSPELVAGILGLMLVFTGGGA